MTSVGLRRSAGKPDASLGPLPAAGLDDLRQLILGTPEPEHGELASAPPALPDREAWVQQARAELAELQGLGFGADDALRALRATPAAVGTAAQDALLEWLLLHVPPVRLPPAFALQSVGVAGEVSVLQHSERGAEPDAGAVAGCALNIQKQGPASACEPGPAAPPHPATKGPASERTGAAPQSTQDQKAWILQRMEAGSSDDDESGPSSSSGSVEDWEVWGTPQEVAARKAEQARRRLLTALPRDELVAMLQEQLQAALAAARSAKSGRDKSAQQQAGVDVRRIKAEIAEAGITDAELEQAAASCTRPTEGRANGAAGGPAPASKHTGDAHLSSELTVVADASARQLAQAEKEEPLGFDLFDAVDSLSGSGANDSSAPDPAKNGPPPRLLRLAQEKDRACTQSWPTAPPHHRNKKAAPAPVLEQRPPKQVLMKFCQANGLAAPRYDRMEPGGGRNGGQGGIRYSVTVEHLQQGKGRTTKARVICRLPPAEDGWASIEEAQSAAATRALFLTTPESEVLWRNLPDQYQQIWFAWVWAAEDASARQAAGGAAAVSEKEPFTAELEQAYDSLTKAMAGMRTDSMQSGGWASGDSMAQMDAECSGSHDNQSDPDRRASAAALSRRLQADLATWQASKEGRRWACIRGSLPAVKLEAELATALTKGDVAIVAAETGSGKTTQVPQFLLDNGILAGVGATTYVVCVQPRRIAATSVAARVAEERGEAAPGIPKGLVGYQVRLDTAMTDSTRLVFCTPGILLRRLERDPQLRGVSHVVLDEVHERSVQSDFLMTLMRDLVAARRRQAVPGAATAPPPRPLKLVLMSATLDSAKLSAYFGGAPCLITPGRTFPVQRHYLEDAYEATGYQLDQDSPAALREGRQFSRGTGHGGAGGARPRHRDLATGAKTAIMKAGWGDDEEAGPVNPNYDASLYDGYSTQTRRNLARLDEQAIDLDLAEAVVDYLDEHGEPGAILVFLPGMDEIARLRDRLDRDVFREGEPGGQQDGLLGKTPSCRRAVMVLHSAVPRQEQRRAFAVPPPGVRKIVLATNIAETSVTIEDAVHVVDSGRLHERRYDPSRHMSVLARAWVSAAAASQRAGRAGRVRPGHCWALYTRTRAENRLQPHQAPEVERVPLEELVLDAHALCDAWRGHGHTPKRMPARQQPAESRSFAAPSKALSPAARPEQQSALSTSIVSSSDALSDDDALDISRERAGARTAAACWDSSDEEETPGSDKHAAAAAAPVATNSELAAPVSPSTLHVSTATALLQRCLSPPPARSVAAAEEVLRGVGALDPGSTLTPLGRALAGLPLDVRLAKLLLLGVAMGVAAPALDVAAWLAHGGRLYTNRKAAVRAAVAAGADTGAVASSDHAAAAAVLTAWRRRHGAGFRNALLPRARESGLDPETLRAVLDLRRQYAVVLADLGWVRLRRGHGPARDGWTEDAQLPANRHADRPAVVLACFAVAFGPSFAVLDSGAVDNPHRQAQWREGADQVHLRHDSCLAELRPGALPSPFIAHTGKMRTSKLFLRECTSVSPLAALLFGADLRLHSSIGLATLAGDIRIKVPASTGVLIKRARLRLERVLGGMAARHDKAPTVDEARLIDTIARLLGAEAASKQLSTA